MKNLKTGEDMLQEKFDKVLHEYKTFQKHLDDIAETIIKGRKEFYEYVKNEQLTTEDKVKKYIDLDFIPKMKANDIGILTLRLQTLYAVLKDDIEVSEEDAKMIENIAHPITYFAVREGEVVQVLDNAKKEEVYQAASQEIEKVLKHFVEENE